MLPGVKMKYGVQSFTGELMVSKLLHGVVILLRIVGLVGMSPLQKALARRLSCIAFA